MKAKRYAILNILLIIRLGACTIGTDQNDEMCSFNQTGSVANICSSGNRLVHASEIEKGCEKCWCILVDNRNGGYYGEIIIELVQTNNQQNSQLDGRQHGHIKSYLSFTIISGINQIVVLPGTSADLVTEIKSIKIQNIEICRNASLETPAQQQIEPFMTNITKITANQSIIPNELNIKNKCGNFISSSYNSPWHAAIYKLQSTINRHFICGGTLIDRKTIVTAAHCVLELNLVVIPERFLILLGHRDDLIHAVSANEYRVSDVIVHEAYNPDSFENDVALLVLVKDVQLTSNVNFVCLPKPNFSLPNQIGMTVGWGGDGDRDTKMQSALTAIKLAVVDKIDCLSSNREFVGQYLSNTNFCAGIVNKTTTVCQTDSGSGLIFKSDGQLYLGGIFSLGIPSRTNITKCDLTILTDVSKFIEWINQKHKI